MRTELTNVPQLLLVALHLRKTAHIPDQARDMLFREAL